MTSLEAENAALRNQIERLQMTQDVLRKDLQSARCSLGPWFRPADSQPPLAPAAHARPERLVQRHRMSVPLSSASFGHPLDFMEGADSGIHVHSTTTIHDPSLSLNMSLIIPPHLTWRTHECPHILMPKPGLLLLI